MAMRLKIWLLLDATDRHCPHKSQLGARTFLPELRICFGFNLKMIEAFLDGPSNGKYNSQRLAGARERNIKYFEEKSVCQCISSC